MRDRVSVTLDMREGERVKVKVKEKEKSESEAKRVEPSRIILIVSIDII